MIITVFIVYVRGRRTTGHIAQDGQDERPMGVLRGVIHSDQLLVHSDDEESLPEDDPPVPAIHRPIRSSRWSPLLLAIGSKEVLAPLFQFVPQFRTPLQSWRKVVQSVRAFFGVISHTPSEGYTMRHVEGRECRHLRPNEEEDPNSAPESASGTDQDCQVVVQY